MADGPSAKCVLSDVRDGMMNHLPREAGRRNSYKKNASVVWVAVKHARGEQTFDKTTLGQTTQNDLSMHLWVLNRHKSVNALCQHNLA